MNLFGIPMFRRSIRQTFTTTCNDAQQFREKVLTDAELNQALTRWTRVT